MEWHSRYWRKFWNRVPELLRFINTTIFLEYIGSEFSIETFLIF